MLTTLEITDFQSIHHLKLRLGRGLTVITGPTGSGKTAVIRALRLLAFNARGNAFIRHGQKLSKVDLIWDDPSGPCMAGIERGARGKDACRLAIPGQAGDKVFTKLGGKIPEEIIQALGLSDLNFAQQLDSPFLLTDTAGEVARRLGALTNVVLVFRAAQEADKRRLRLAGRLKDKEEELARLREEAQSYRGLLDRRRALETAEACHREYLEVQQRVIRFRELVGRLRAAEQALASITLPEVPDVRGPEGIVQHAARLRYLVEQVRQWAAGEQSWIVQAGALAQEQRKLEEEYHQLLVQAGQCPTCGQQVADGSRHG
jgi:exonuclease SbcC